MGNAAEEAAAIAPISEAWLCVRVVWVVMLVILKAPDGNEYGSSLYKPEKSRLKFTSDLFLSQTLDYTSVFITNAINKGGRITIDTIVLVT